MDDDWYSPHQLLAGDVESRLDYLLLILIVQSHWPVNPRDWLRIIDVIDNNIT